MSRGGLINDDNQVKETALPAPGDWASEYQQQYNLGDAWAVEDQWVDEFSKLNVNDWADEFGQQGSGPTSRSQNNQTQSSS
ncbi:hypothetical protein P8452_33181 [Trifolium repens]|nr:hypothetical protein P8452_33181 [Trifolium repens]